MSRRTRGNPGPADPQEEDAYTRQITKRQRKEGDDAAVFDYPPIPLSIQHPSNSQGRKSWLATTVDGTSSTQWGSPTLAAARALLEPTVSESNMQLLRTHHPGLAYANHVGICTNVNSKRYWLLNDLTHEPRHTHAGGLEIHIVPSGQVFPTLCYPLPPRPDALEAALGGPMNLHRMLDPEQMAILRDMYPKSVGSQVYLGCKVIILYEKTEHMDSDWRQRASPRAGGYPAEFGVLQNYPTNSTSTTHGQAVIQSKTTRPPETHGCIGLRIKMPVGEFITTVTHGFVYLPPSKGLLVQTANFFLKVKDNIQRMFRPPSMPHLEEGVVTAGKCITDGGQLLSNSPLGKPVFLSSTLMEIGTIQRTFDSPSLLLPFPCGYYHDLSLIGPLPSRSSCFPHVVQPSGFPVVRGWAPYDKVMDGAPIFVSSSQAGIELERDVAEGIVVSAKDRKAYVEEMETAIMEGVQYIWDRQFSRQSASFLWRVTVQEPNDMFAQKSLVGFSGSVLCMGKASDSSAKAVVFQNFQTSPNFARPSGRAPASWLLKGGFLLPQVVRDASIICAEDYERRLSGSCPKWRSPEAGFHKKARNVSGF